MKKRVFAIALLILIFLGNIYATESPKKEVEILFTHDLHSHLEEFLLLSGDEEEMVGGFPRIKTIIDQKQSQNPNVFVFDGGDFSMGTLYQTIFEQASPELRLMGAMGFDATTIGNHEFDYRTSGILNMMETAIESGDPLPEVVLSNAKITGTPFEALHTKPYVIITKGDITAAVFGVFGVDALACAPTCELEFIPAAEAAQQVIAEIKENYDVDIIVCLSHGGTNANISKSEDHLLAQAVPEIDIIVSGHTHTRLDTPAKQGNTWIVSAGEYGSRLGNIVLTQNQENRWDLKEYELILLDDSVPQDQDTLQQIQTFKSDINHIYLEQFGYTIDQVLTENPYRFSAIYQLGNKLEEDTLGNIIADAYVYAVQNIEKEAYRPIAAAIVPAGIIRDTIPMGPVTVEHAFQISSLGVGPDQIPGYPLIEVYLTGKELMTAAEIDASISPLMPSAQLYCSGLYYKANDKRLILNKTTDVWLVDQNGNRQEIQKDKLYRVVADLYSGQMLSAVTDMSKGILSIVPKDKDGNPVVDLEKQILYDGSQEVKAWTTLAGYLDSMDQIPTKYSAPEGRKIIESSLNPWELLKNPNTIALIVYAVAIIVLVGIIALVVFTVKKIKNRKK